MKLHIIRPSMSLLMSRVVGMAVLLLPPLLLLLLLEQNGWRMMPATRAEFLFNGQHTDIEQTDKNANANPVYAYGGGPTESPVDRRRGSFKQSLVNYQENLDAHTLPPTRNNIKESVINYQTNIDAYTIAPERNHIRESIVNYQRGVTRVGGAQPVNQSVINYSPDAVDANARAEHRAHLNESVINYQAGLTRQEHTEDEGRHGKMKRNKLDFSDGPFARKIRRRRSKSKRKRQTGYGSNFKHAIGRLRIPKYLRTSIHAKLFTKRKAKSAGQRDDSFRIDLSFAKNPKLFKRKLFSGKGRVDKFKLEPN